MAQGAESSQASSGRTWHQISIAFLLGYITFAFMSAFVTVHQPAIGPTIDALPLFVIALVVGVISLPLLWWETLAGYGLTFIAGVWALVGLWLIGSGTIGGIKAGSNPIGIPVVVLVAGILIVSTYLAWRK